MKQTRIITFRSDANVDNALKQIQEITQKISKLECKESIAIRSAILWYADDLIKSEKLDNK